VPEWEGGSRLWTEVEQASPQFGNHFAGDSEPRDSASRVAPGAAHQCAAGRRTNSDLRAEVLAGHFREDLFYRLRSIQIRIPSLTERLEDIPHFFLKKYHSAYGKNILGLTRRAQPVLLRHGWPGNVRELENVISSACITTSGDFIDLADLPEQRQQGQKSSLGSDDWKPLSHEEVRKVHIQRVLQMCQRNRLRAAQFLGIGRTSLYRCLKRDGLEIRKEKTGEAAAWDQA